MNFAALGRRLLSFLVLPVIGYGAICGWMYAQQRSMMYFPQFTQVGVEQTDFSLSTADGRLHGWRVNEEGRGAILYFGGNAESVEDNRAEFARWFPDSSVYLVPYRGYGPNAGNPSEAALFADALALFDHVRSAQPNAPIIVIGRSLGSGVASYVASQRPVAKLALVTPFDSMADVAQAHYPWLPVRWLLRDRYESALYLADYAGPVLIVRAGRDQVIPGANTDRLAATLRAPQILDLPEADHNSIDRYPAYGEALSAFAATR